MLTTENKGLYIILIKFLLECWDPSGDLFLLGESSMKKLNLIHALISEIGIIQKLINKSNKVLLKLILIIII